MTKFKRRVPNGHNGTAITTRRLADIVPSVLSKVQSIHDGGHNLIIAAWPQIVGQKIAKFTTPVSFVDSILKVKVNNSTLYSILMQSEKGKLLSELRKRFPKVEIKNIFFRMG